MSVDEQRAWFEAWCISEGINAERSPVTGVYSYPSARVAWRAWKAAESAAIERCAKVVRSEELCDAGDTADDIAYNHAIDHAEQAIRALLPKED